MIGRGITPRWNTGDKTLDEEILNLWNISSFELDSTGTFDVPGLQELIARTFILSGDALAQYRYQKPTSDLAVPLQLSIMESDQFYEDYNGLLTNGNQLIMGKEFNKSNVCIRYHLYKHHPGEYATSTLANPYDVVQVKASDILHVYKPLRPGQVRGWPRLAGVLTRLKAIDEFEDAVLDTQKTAAMFSAFITKPDGEPVDPGVMGDTVTYDSIDYLGLEAGTITTLGPGEGVQFAKPPELSQAYSPWMRNQLLRIAAAFGTTYEQLTGDLEGANWATIRAALLEFQRRCRMLQFNIMVHQFLRPMARTWLDTAVLANSIRIPRYSKYRRLITATTWDPDGWEWIDPIKHANANKINVRCGFKSRSQVVGETGRNSEVVDSEIATDNDRADESDLVYDSDPRHGKDNTDNTMANPNKEEEPTTEPTKKTPTKEPDNA
jgi:lambda family phage portal protein